MKGVINIDYSNIVDFIIKTVQSESILSGLQYVVSYSSIKDKFNIKLSSTNIKEIETILWKREEIAGVEVDQYGFDVVLYTAYTPNYIEEDDIY